MEITYHGLSCVRLRGRDIQVVVDPPDTALPGMAKNGPDVIVRTDKPTDTDRLRLVEGRSQEVSGAGEFEVRGVNVHGIPAGGDATIVRVEVEEVKVVSVGKLSRQLSEDEIDELGHVDVLVVPVGGGDVLNAAAATKLVHALEPAIVVPVRYRNGGPGSGEYEPVETFAKEMGLAEGSWQAQGKLTLSGSTGSVDETRVVILESR